MSSTPPKRITLKNIGENLLEILNLERGIFFTIAGLAVRPGKTIREYLYENRRKAVQPLKFLVITGIISSIVSYFFGESMPDVAEVYTTIFRELSLPIFSDLEIAGQKFKDFVIAYEGLLVSLSVPLIAAITFLIFRKINYNYAEHLVIGAYFLGFYNLLKSLSLICAASNIYILALLAAIPLILYILYFPIRVFQLSLGRGLLLAILFVIVINTLSLLINCLLFIIVSAS